MSIGFLKEKQGWFTKAILFLLAITFVVGFGYVGKISLGNGGGTGNTTAVEVNGESIPLARYHVVKENMIKRFAQNGQQVPESAREYINYSAMKQLIESKLLAQKARELGFRVTDEELGEAIRSNPSFQYNGQFIGKKNYEDTIRRALNISVADFENEYRDQLLVEKLVSMIDETAKVTDEELKNLYKTKNEEVSLYYLDFSPENYTKSGTISEKEIKDYYENNKSEFLTDEKRKIKYLKLSRNSFKKDIPVTDQEIEAYYKSYKDEFRDADGNVKDLSRVKNQIKDILKTRKSDGVYQSFINSVADNKDQTIEKLAKENGFGDIRESGYFTTSGNDKAIPDLVRQKAFTLNTGELSYTRGQDNIWLIQLVDKKEPEIRSLDKVKDIVVKKLSIEKGQHAARIAAEETLNKIKDSGKSFKQVADTTGMKIKQTDYFTRIKPPSIFKSDNELVIDAFMLNNEKPTAAKVYSSGGHYYIISLDDKKGFDINDFRDKQDSLKQQELARLRRNIISGWVNELYSKADIVYNKRILAELPGAPASS